MHQASVEIDEIKRSRSSPNFSLSVGEHTVEIWIEEMGRAFVRKSNEQVEEDFYAACSGCWTRITGATCQTDALHVIGP